MVALLTHIFGQRYFYALDARGLWKCNVKFRADKDKTNIPQSQIGIVASNSSVLENSSKNAWLCWERERLDPFQWDFGLKSPTQVQKKQFHHVG